MTTLLFRRQWIVTALVIAMMLASAWVVVVPAQADAQAGAEPTMRLAVSDLDRDGYQTLALAIDPGASGVAGIDGYLTYDPSVVDIVGCAVSEAGACHETDGTVRYSVFNLASIAASEKLVTVDFTITDSTSGSAEFGGGTTAVFNTLVQELAAVEVAPVVVETTVAATGSATGEVLDDTTQVGLYNIDVCMTHVVSEAEHCTISTGLGNWRLDDVPVGDYLIDFIDASGSYTSDAASVTIVADEIATGLVALLTNPDEVDWVETVSGAAENENTGEGEDAANSDTQGSLAANDEIVEELPQSGDAPRRQLTPVEERTYEAAISGVVVAFESGTGVEAVQVCATQPLVLHQRCSTTQADGTFVLSGISTGNYWVTAVDPLGQLVDVDTELVGVMGRDSVRAGVRLVLVSAD